MRPACVPHTRPRVTGVLVLLAAVFSLTATARAQETNQELLDRGRLIYSAKCASCHGDKGQGVPDEYADPLIGDATVGELTKLISETMPDGEPEVCVAEDARAVAEFIHFTFYSEAARIRNRPPRIGLARLTASQLRQSLADLYARPNSLIVDSTEQRGLKAQYFDGARFRRNNKRIERVDAVLDFDFGHEGPGEKINPKDYAIQWTGGLRADDTGRYELIVRSTCAFVCRFGGYRRELINNHVQSAGRTEFRRVVHLTGGRVYPLQIDFFQRKRKTEQPPARISLSWVPPHGTEQIVPARNLTQGAVNTFPLQTKLPPDDRSYGYDRGIAIDTQWDESTTAAAIEFSELAVEELWPDYKRRHRREPNENRAQLRAFLTEFAEVAFRGPLTDSLKALYVDQQVDATQDDAEAIKRSLLAVLKSPRFLYPLLDNDRSVSQRVANRLTLVLFDSLPADQWLRQRIANNRLESTPQIREAASQMVNDVRVRGKTRQLLHEWLHLTQLEEITKNSDVFPEFNEQLVADLRQSLDTFLDEVVWSESSDYRELFLSHRVPTTKRLAAFYGPAWQPADENGPPLRWSVPDEEHRYGVLTHPYLMSALGYRDTSSPIHRGVFLIRYLLGRTLRPPNAAFTPLSPDLHPDLTTRERVHLQTSPENCQVCHSRINALGFALENFDAVGRYREQERNKPIDASGSYTTLADQQVTFTGPGDLAEFLAGSRDAHRAFVSRAFQHFVKQPVAAYGAETLDELTESFRANGYNIRRLIVDIAVIAAGDVLHDRQDNNTDANTN